MDYISKLSELKELIKNQEAPGSIVKLAARHLILAYYHDISSDIIAEIFEALEEFRPELAKELPKEWTRESALIKNLAKELVKANQPRQTIG